MMFRYPSITIKNLCNIYTAIFHGSKNDNFLMKIFDMFLFVLTSTQNLCLKAKIKKC